MGNEHSPFPVNPKLEEAFKQFEALNEWFNLMKD
jgi:hypothetical protein